MSSAAICPDLFDGIRNKVRLSVPDSPQPGTPRKIHDGPPAPPRQTSGHIFAIPAHPVPGFPSDRSRNIPQGQLLRIGNRCGIPESPSSFPLPEGVRSHREEPPEAGCRLFFHRPRMILTLDIHMPGSTRQRRIQDQINLMSRPGSARKHHISPQRPVKACLFSPKQRFQRLSDQYFISPSRALYSVFCDQFPISFQ